jgi:hypothetical protein
LLPSQNVDGLSTPLTASGGAYWLLDEIVIIEPYNKAVAAEEFQTWNSPRISTDAPR